MSGLRVMTDTPDLATLFARHERAVLAFSGGKDSLVCLDLCRDYRDKLDVCWTNTGAMFPHMVEDMTPDERDAELARLENDLMAMMSPNEAKAEIQRLQGGIAELLKIEAKATAIDVD